MKDYRAVLRQPGVARWSVVRVLTRFPMVAAPISFVLLSKTVLGGYSTGAWMAACCVATEMVAAPLLGARLDRRPMLGELRGALAVTTAALLGVAFGAGRIPTWALVALAALSGGAIAGLMGGLRSLLVRSLPADRLRAALSWESMLHQAVFAVSPVLVTGLALGIGGRIPLVLMAVTSALAGVLMNGLPNVREAPDAPVPQVRGASMRAVMSGWPVYFTSAAAMYLSAVIEVALAPLLQQEHIAIGWAGGLLTAFSVASVVGSYWYGLRDWPGSYRVHSVVLLTAEAVLVGAAALGSRIGLVLLALPLVLAGAAQAGLITARNLSLAERLPAHSRSAGNSTLYASSCLGYGASSIAIALFVPHGGALRLALGSCVLAVVVGWGGAAAEFLSGRGSRRQVGAVAAEGLATGVPRESAES